MAVKSLEDMNKELAQRVIDLDDKIDEINRRIEDSVYQIIARYNPLAKDLRYSITMVKFANNLERIGDLSCNIAQKTLNFCSNNLKYSLNKSIRKMIGISLDMIKDTFKAFGEKDINLAVETWKKDNLIDELEISIGNYVLNSIKEDNLKQELIIPYILIARDIERIADHATNLCEEIVYIETGKEIDSYL